MHFFLKSNRIRGTGCKTRDREDKKNSKIEEKRGERFTKDEMLSTDNPFTPKHTLGY